MKLAITCLVLSLGIVLSGIVGADTGSRGLVRINDTKGKQVGLYKDSHALLIGVSDYTAGWPDLPGVRKDLKAVKKALERHDFNVVVIKDPNRDQIQRAYRDFINQYGRKPDSRLLLYFAGHGHTERTAWGGEMGYIVPANAPNPHRDHNGFLDLALDMVQIEVYAKRIQSKHALFMFDSCFSGSIFALSRAVPENISYKTAQPVRQFLTSGSADEQVPDKSIFRDQFIEALSGEGDRNKDGYVTGVELGEFLQEKVINYSNGAQHPQYGKIRHPRLDKGDIVFVAGGSVVEETPMPLPETNTGTVKIKTKPPGATVWIDGKRRGTAPVSIPQLKPGRIRVKASKEGYETVEEQVWVRAGKASEVTLILENTVVAGGIEIKSTPAGAKWYLDGAYAGTTPDTMANVGKGTHQIEVIKPGYQPWVRSIEIKVGRNARLNAHLQAEKVEYALTVDTEPRDARVRILNIGPRYYAGIRLKPGRYHVEVSKAGHETHKEWIEIADADRVVEVALRSGREWVDPVTGMEFVRVPGGCFRMGQSAEEKRQIVQERGQEEYQKYFAVELPRHEVCVDGFWMGKYEVSNAQYRRYKAGHDSGKYKGHSLNGDRQPAVEVSWEDVLAYAKWLSGKGSGRFRLPTEAEWEYAARAGTTTIRYWGDAPDMACRYANVADKAAKREWPSWWNIHDCDDGYKVSAPIGSFRANELGLHDMLGNVFEWIGDWYGEGYYSKSPKHNPKGPGEGAKRVVRGGSWGNNPAGVRAAYRNRRTPGYRYYSLGFRLLRTDP